MSDFFACPICKWTCRDKFVVEEIEYDDKRNIVALTIRNDSLKCRCFAMGNANKKNDDVKQTVKKRRELEHEILQMCHDKNMTVEEVCKIAKVEKLADLNEERLQACLDWLAMN